MIEHAEQCEYFVDGTPCNGDDYLPHLQRVFSPAPEDIIIIARHDGQSLSFAVATPLFIASWYKLDGSMWSLERSENLTFERACEMANAFVTTDDDRLESFGWEKIGLNDEEGRRLWRGLLITVAILYGLAILVHFLVN